MLTFGIEEEFVLLDQTRLSPINAAANIHQALLAAGVQPSVVHREFFQSQLEFASPVFTELATAAAHLSSFRAALSRAADAQNVLAAGVGTPYNLDGSPALSHGTRYDEVASNVRGLTADHHINGVHVHVGIPGREAGVVALNGVRRWLPVLLAISANSPYWRGTDTGYASWRTIHSRRWTTAGCPPVFADAADYDRRIRSLTGIGATADAGTIAWYARLSERQPTLEFRVADAQLDGDGSLLIAALCRALVATTLRARTVQDQPAPELLDAALWHAARDGLTGTLVHPLRGVLVPAAKALEVLLAQIHKELANAGDMAAVERILATMMARGTGAELQRHAIATGGAPALGDLIKEQLMPGRGSSHPP